MTVASAGDSPMTRLLQLGGELVTPAGAPRRKFDLAHMRALLRALGNPERSFPSVLIAGTNGKGSTASTLASILTAAGYRTGLYTSPHLERVNERIRFSNVGSSGLAGSLSELEDDQLFALFARVEETAARLESSGILPWAPSFFEVMTAIAMLAFSSPGDGRPIDLAVLEVGMGGRLDATNVVEPLFSVITDISLDHTEWLGPTLAAIAREKAGILRAGGVMVTLPQHPEANQALGEIAVALGVRGVNAAEYLPGREQVSQHDGSYSICLGGEQVAIQSPLRGQHQQRNLSLALASAAELRNSHGYKIDRAAIEAGVRGTSWPGRLEEISGPPGLRIVLDVAHNPAGAWALRAALSAEEAQRMAADGRKELIFGCMRDKAIAEMAQILFPVFERVHLAELPSPRSAAAVELVEVAQATGARFTVSAGPEQAFDAARAELGPGDLLAGCGSVVLVGALRTLLRQ